MYIKKVRQKFTDEELYTISCILHSYFELVEVPRIYDLILQVDSVDTALWLLLQHRESENTLDYILFYYLEGKDNK
jgi:hypothetical protein